MQGRLRRREINRAGEIDGFGGRKGWLGLWKGVVSDGNIYV